MVPSMTFKYRLVHGLNLRLPTDGKMFLLEEIFLDSSEINDCVDSFVKEVFNQHNISSKNLMVFSFYDPVRKDWLDNRMHEVYINVKPKCIKKAIKAVEKTQKEMSEKRLTINDFINWDIETKNGRNTLCFRINYNSKNEHSIYRLLIKNVKNNWDLGWCEVTEFGDEFDFKNYQHVTDCFIKKFLPKAPGHYGYVFLLTRGKKLYGVCFLYSSEYISKPKLEAMAHDFDVVFRIYLHHYLSDAVEMAVSQACKAAAAAIMARNISHNIGSHVLPKVEIGNVREKLKQVYSRKRSDGRVITPMALNIYGMIEGIKTRLDRYIQYKSDFLAEITTEPLYSIRNARFFQDVMATFLGNTLLIDNIAAMEGLGYEEKWCVDWEKWQEDQKQREKFNEFPRATLRIRCFRKENALKREYKSLFQKADGETAYFYDNVFVPYGWRDIESNNENIVFVGLSEDSPQDIEIALPGPMGEFAFYGFLENIIRNAAKHNKALIQKRRDQDHKFALEIHVEIKDDPDNPDDYYRLRIYDNVSKSEPENVGGKCLSCSKLQKYLEKDLVDNAGYPRREAWGLAEMMICANLLAGTKSFKYQKKNLSVECEDVSTGKGKYANRLVYYLRLMKPKKVALIGLSLFGDIFRQKQTNYGKDGIRFFESLKAFSEAASQSSSSIAAFDFALISKDEANSLGQYRHLLPLRILQIDPTLAGKLPEVTSEGDLCVAEDILFGLNTGSGKFIHSLWQLWLQRWNQPDRKDKPCAGLDVYLGQKGNTFPTTLWKDKIEKLDSTLPIRLWGQDNGVVSIITGDKDKTPASRVLFDRHGEILDKTEELTDQDAYIMIDKLSSDFSKVFRPPESDSWVFPYELIEAGLLRVLILDERVAERAVKSIRSSDVDVNKIASYLVKDGFNPAYWHVARRSQVLIATHLLFSPDGETLHNDAKKSVLKDAIHAQSFNDQYDHYMADDKNSEKNMKSTCPELDLVVNDDKVDIFINPIGRKSEREPARPFEKYGIDILLIHQGIIDNLPGSWRENDKFIKRLRKFIPWVIVESGRGIPPEVQESKEKFLPFSVVNHWMDGTRVGKLSLAQTVMTLTRNKKQ